MAASPPVNPGRFWRFSRTRLAPSPTGALHLGHARTFLITWLLARQAGAQIVMRMEDLDAARARAESIAQAYDDLRWLGLDWDVGAGLPGASEQYVQSHRTAIYAAALARLRAPGVGQARAAIYPCTCTRARIAEAVAAGGQAPHETDVQVRYPGTCRGKSREQIVGEAAPPGLGACWRLRVEPGSVGFDDALMGRQGFDVAAEAGDFPVTRFGALGPGLAPPPPPAYQLACVVDDHEMDIDAVIRGDDLLSSTPRQLLIYRALGYAPPAFGHVGLVIGPDGKRLAKRHGESRIAQFRAAGVRPERVVGWVAWRSGQIERPEEMSAAELLRRFDVGRLPRARVVMAAEDLAFLRR
jgi:glutamyl-tRNA synthetase